VNFNRGSDGEQTALFVYASGSDDVAEVAGAFCTEHGISACSQIITALEEEQRMALHRGQFINAEPMDPESESSDNARRVAELEAENHALRYELRRHAIAEYERGLHSLNDATTRRTTCDAYLRTNARTIAAALDTVPLGHSHRGASGLVRF
jgi:hypothetical protein